MWSLLSSAVPGRVSTVSDCSGRSMVGLSSEEVLSPSPSPSVGWSVLSPVEATGCSLGVVSSAGVSVSALLGVSVSALLLASGTTVTCRPESSVSDRASAAEAPHMPTELLSTERASVIATICFFLDFFLIIVILTSLETVFLAQLFRNLQHKIDARWAVLIILYYIRFPKISRGQIARKKACAEISAD